MRAARPFALTAITLLLVRGALADDPMEQMPPPDSGWATMLHGFAFLTANRQGGPSGDRDFESQNHLMVTSVRKLWGGKLSLLGTFSLEPATIPPGGSPQLFQRGEAYHGVLLVDRQHPHDLFAQLGAAWERAVSDSLTFRLYAAPRGEPALGPVAYPHRLSTSENPVAPLSHHNQDSTHIATDVVTVGLAAGPATLEGSAFHGGEPDENRWDLEQGRLDSASGRITLQPARGFSLQASVGRMKHPEHIEPGNQTRFTASASYERAIAAGFVAISAIVGKNQTPEGPEWGNLLEATLWFAKRNSVFGRWEQVDRDAGELERKAQLPEGAPRRRVKVDAFTAGFVRDVPVVPPLVTGLGAALTLYSFPGELQETYGRRPVSVQVFLLIRFGTHEAHPHEEEHTGHADHGGTTTPMPMPMPR